MNSNFEQSLPSHQSISLYPSIKSTVAEIVFTRYAIGRQPKGLNASSRIMAHVLVDKHNRFEELEIAHFIHKILTH